MYGGREGGGEMGGGKYASSGSPLHFGENCKLDRLCPAMPQLLYAAFCSACFWDWAVRDTSKVILFIDTAGA